MKDEKAYKYATFIECMAADIIHHLLESADPPFAFAEDKSPNGYNLYEDLWKRLDPKVHEEFIRDNLEDLEEEGAILLEGPTGTGKTTAVEYFCKRDTSGRKNLQYFNVTGIPQGLVELKVRGCAKGYATGTAAQEGFFEKADKGILFLDEFQNAPEFLQTQLLDLIKPLSNDAKITRPGPKEAEAKYNVKVFIAVNEPIRELIDNGILREDFFWRIRKRIKFPSLKDSIDEKKTNGKVRLLFLWRLFRYKYPLSRNNIDRLYNKYIQPNSDNYKQDRDNYFHSDSCGQALFIEFEEDALNWMQNYDWPGNFRQLEVLAYKVYRELEKKGFKGGNKPRISRQDLRSLIYDYRDDLAERSNKTETQHVITNPIEKDRNIAKAIETALDVHAFDLKAAAEALRDSKIGNYRTLVDKICKYEMHFSDKVRSNPKIQRILEKHKNKIE